jgi:hypothetical protein
MKYFNNKILTLVLILLGLTNSQTLTVRYIYGDEPGVGPQIFGQWELIDSNNNSQFFESGETVGVNPFENYTIKVSDGASTIDGGENDVSFLLYDVIQSNLNLSNSYFNLGSEGEISVNYYDKIPIEFNVTADLDEVYILDPWHWDEDGNNISELIPVEVVTSEEMGKLIEQKGNIQFKFNAQLSPNPFNPVLNINLDIEQEGQYSIQLFNIKGQFVESVHNGHLFASTS